MTNYNERLDELLKEHGGMLATYSELYRKHHHNPSRHQADIDHAHNIAKQAIIDWHNKHTLELLYGLFDQRILARDKDSRELSDPVVPLSAVVAELDKLKESSNDQDS